MKRHCFAGPEFIGLHDLAEIAEICEKRKLLAKLLRTHLRQKRATKNREMLRRGDDVDNAETCKNACVGASNDNCCGQKELQTLRSGKAEDDIIARAF